MKQKTKEKKISSVYYIFLDIYVVTVIEYVLNNGIQVVYYS